MRARLLMVSLTGVLAATVTGCASSTGGTGEAADPVVTVAPPSATVASTRAAPASSASGPASTAATPGPTGTGPSSSPAGIEPAPARPLRTKAVVAPGGATTYVIKVWAERNVADCAAHAYGAPVIHFLRTHPCHGLGQILATTTVNGRAVGFAQRSIGFSGATADATYRAAGDFTKLVNRDGTGNLNDLLREGYRLPSGPAAVPFPNAFSVLGQDDGVTIVEAWYLHGPTPDNDPALERMARDIFLQY